MKRSGAAKFPNSVQLFKFCQKVMMHQKGGKVRDQEVGAILNFNPSDCSHWKRGEKNVRSVFALAKLADTLGVEIGLIHDVSSGAVNLEEAYFEYLESRSFKTIFSKIEASSADEIKACRESVLRFVETIQNECDFTTPPLYLPEVMHAFAFVSTQPVEMLDKLSRILRVKAGRYCIQFKKGDLKPQTRMSMVKDLARIVFEGERSRFPELGARSGLVAFEETIFTANLLIPKPMLLMELSKLDSRRNVVSELAALFWVPKSLIGFQLQELLLDQTSTTMANIPNTSSEAVDQF
ncbi:hypothetical protein [Pseudobacteriovorax antillogorgiicola]|uniref:Uncharacterized protein n=1 Tax=Pseudobacteriovorax antillogorgiicola TaxID=1513793 RepID=A0A1Y6BD16_9BACT|nr:hypothetical protein [Pseudobacteriovorax antillogorgiicola]TCS58807.1 hypothetical protein EDD56_102322 [Pseudobacteriovorax antillogorgiicola]SME94493.1 hypothetical protein SAMN06296036_102121 [Pseudobacteriovorax antillogorgiicola]